MTQQLNVMKLLQLDPKKFLQFLLETYKDYKITLEGDPNPLFKSFSIGGVVNILKMSSPNNNVCYELYLFGKDINELPDAEAARTILNGTRVCTICKSSDTMKPSDTILKDDNLWNMAQDLFNKCQEHLGIEPEVQPEAKLKQRTNKKSKKFSKESIVFITLLLAMIAGFNVGLYVSKNRYEKSIKEIHDKFQKHIQQEADSLNVLIQKNQIILDSIRREKVNGK